MTSFGRSGLAVTLAISTLLAADWPQFRGVNASGVSGESNLPVEFGPTKNVIWKTAIPPGHSSPSIAGDKVFVTAVEKETLYTIAMDRASGRILWRREAPRPRRQAIERPANGPVSASPVSDGHGVFVFFQDFGLLAYGPDGNEMWRIPLGPFNNAVGHGASPILAGNTLLMNVDQHTDSFLLAVDKSSGRVLWRAARPFAQSGWATPLVYQTAGGSQQVVVAGSFRLVGYDLVTGKEAWWIRGLPWSVKPTPVIDGHVVFFGISAEESNPGEQENVPTFAEALTKMDANKDGKLSEEEIPDEQVRNRFHGYLDLDHSGFLEERDWDHFRERRQGENALRAYRLGGSGDVTESHLLWKHTKSLPRVASPLVYRGILYTLKEGGIFTSHDPKTGAILKQARLTGAIGSYFASPVAAAGMIYTVSEDGKAAVIRAGGDWEVVRVNDMDDGVKATIGIADGRLYLRTYSALYCFGIRE